jgi:hypothetical protein
MEFADFSILIRGLERLVALSIGCFCIWLGYRLFLALPEKPNESTGKFEAPGGISIHISRVGPGVFFALFGSGIVLMSLTQTLKLGSTNTEEQSPQAVYLSDQVSVTVSSEERSMAQRDIRALLELEKRSTQVDMQLTERDRLTLQLVLPRARRALTLENWHAVWGEPQSFRDWWQQGQDEAVIPDQICPAMAFYQGGERLEG